MGFYLSTPNKEKSTSKNKTTKLSYVASSMQGKTKKKNYNNNNTKLYFYLYRMENKYGRCSYRSIKFQQ